MNALTAHIEAVQTALANNRADILAIQSEIEAATGRAPGHLGDYPSTTIKTHLRRLAVAMGIDTHAARDGTVTTDELRKLYDRAITPHDLADLVAQRRGDQEPKPAAQPRPQPFPAAPVASATPRPAAPTPDQSQALQQMASAMAALLANPQAQQIDPAQVRAIAAEVVAEANDGLVERVSGQFLDALPALVTEIVAKQVRTIEIKTAAAPAVKIDQAHKLLPELLPWLANGVDCYVAGPAGSGKTTMAMQAAKALGRPFHMTGAIDSPFALLGFKDASGQYHRTPFRDAFEHGGVFLFDEVDGSEAGAILPFNSALANRICAFPDGVVKGHPDFVAIAAANTWGHGATREYVGRNELDAATLDRFARFACDYDEELERVICGDEAWARRVQAIRAAVRSEKVRRVISPRASIMGAKLLATGMDQAKVEQATIWEGMDEATVARVKAAIGRFA